MFEIAHSTCFPNAMVPALNTHPHITMSAHLFWFKWYNSRMRQPDWCSERRGDKLQTQHALLP